MMGKKKKIKFFGVIYNKIKNGAFLTVTNSKKEALEYLLILMKMNHLFHYKLWCEMRNFSINSEEAWVQYFRDCITEEEKSSYKIISFHYTVANIASLARMFAGCIPLGASFDNEAEYSLLKNKLEKGTLGSAMVKAIELNRDVNPRQIEIVWEDIKKGENKNNGKE